MKKLYKIAAFTLLVVAVVFFASAYLVTVRAAVSGNATNLLGGPMWVTGGSATTTAIQISLTGNAGESLAAITISVADATSTGFLTSDLAALGTSTNSGISLYSASSGFLEASTT